MILDSLQNFQYIYTLMYFILFIYIILHFIQLLLNISYIILKLIYHPICCITLTLDNDFSHFLHINLYYILQSTLPEPMQQREFVHFSLEATRPPAL